MRDLTPYVPTQPKVEQPKANDRLNPDPLLTRKEAATYLGNCSADTLAVQACHGRGPKFIKIGRAVRYPRSSLDAFLLDQVKDMPVERIPDSYLQRLHQQGWSKFNSHNRKDS